MNTAHALNLRNEAGQSMVEFAFSAIVLFMLIYMGLDLIRFGYSTLTLHFVLSQSARYAVVGTLHDASGNLDTQTRTNQTLRVAAIKRQAKKIAANFGVTIDDSNIQICKMIDKNQPASCPPGTDDPGGSKDYFQMSIHRVFFFIWRAIPYDQTITVLAKNEPF